MVERIGKDNALAREALRAALRAGAPAGEVRSPPGAAPEQAGAAPGADFGRVLDAGLAEVDQKVRSAEQLPFDLLTGKVNDFHEIAVQLKNSELSFRFAMEIRNKLLEAYREIMRMSV